ncbi:(d)CMP kinase [Nocardioides sp. GY 10127]|uniref:(d)CMP kinase n=1 Tax=Nocardioides sp. GY 10127 TaxID=2569762 RepID=UPI0010A85E06|nr:(d)CMP kinase [Nocardioides sp. GY 10127]TIC86359.1 (d)CMP kinase [Nocardioides sp. GY 10127]
MSSADDPQTQPRTTSEGSTPFVVAVDGTSGSGKSSTCRAVAQRLGLAYLDTGAQYRAMTWWMLEQGVDVHDPAAVAARSGEPDLVSGTDPSAPTITVDGTDVSAPIRGDAVNGAVSPVATVPEVRARLVDLQRATIAAATSGIVVEGRDIGSTVAPDAPVKLYLTADPAARARRRALEEGGTDVAATEASLRSRDAIDSGRATSPLTITDGAVRIDSTDLTLEQVVDLVTGLVEEARLGAGART